MKNNKNLLRFFEILKSVELVLALIDQKFSNIVLFTRILHIAYWGKYTVYEGTKVHKGGLKPDAFHFHFMKVQ